MDLAKTLIRSVARAFYDKKQVLIIDALLIHSALNNSDLAFLMGTNPKDLRKSCGRLKEDKLMTTHSRQETREGQSRPINIDYYYVNLHIAIDAIKYRVVKLAQNVKKMYQPSEERKEFYCPRCKSEWTMMEVLHKHRPEGFECDRCGALLEQNDQATGDASGHERHSKLMSQLKKVLNLLEQIDEAEIPNNDFEAAFAVAVPVQRNEQVNPSRPTVPLNTAKVKPATVKGITQAAAPLAISLTTASEKTASEQAAEASRKAAIADQNTLPEWIRTSTVTGEPSAAGMRERERQSTNTLLGAGKVEEDEKKDVDVDDDAVARFYAQMAKEKAADEARKAEEDEEEDDEEEDYDEADFEDVAVDGFEAETPQNSLAAAANGNSNGLANGLLKPQETESGSSAPGTGLSTPAGSQALPADTGGPPAKRPKLESAKNGAETPANDSDEDDEDGFEDAL